MAGLVVADIFDEIRDDLRAERAQYLLRRYGVLLVVLLVVAIAGVAGWQAWRWRQARQTEQVATTFLDAMRKSDSVPAAAGSVASPARDQAAAEFATIASSGPEGYRTLARLREAALRVAAGDSPAALQLWDQIGADTAADPLLRDLAALLWAQNQVDHGDPEAIESHLAGLVGTGNPWRPLGQETQALLSLRTGQDGRARDLLKQLNADPGAPDGVRARAGALLSRLGDPPPTAPAAGIGE